MAIAMCAKGPAERMHFTRNKLKAVDAWYTDSGTAVEASYAATQTFERIREREVSRGTIPWMLLGVICIHTRSRNHLEPFSTGGLGI